MLKKYFTSNDGTKIYYEMDGQGAPLVFLHGNSQTGHIFKRQVDFFKHEFTCITIDSRAHGRSFFDGERITFERLAEDLLEIIDEEGFDKINLLGFSDGANIAMMFATKYPERLNRLILNAGNMSQMGLYAMSRFSSKIAYFFVKLFGKNLSVVKLLLDDTGLQKEDLAKISSPTLVVNGQFDVVKISHAKEIARNIPDARLIIVKRATHSYFYFHPKRFNLMVNYFLHNDNE